MYMKEISHFNIQKIGVNRCRGTDRRSTLMIRVRVNSKLELVSDRSEIPRNVLLFSRPLPRDGGMAENHGAPEAGQLSGAWTRGRRVTESHQRARGAKSP